MNFLFTILSNLFGRDKTAFRKPVPLKPKKPNESGQINWLFSFFFIRYHWPHSLAAHCLIYTPVYCIMRVHLCAFEKSCIMMTTLTIIFPFENMRYISFIYDFSTGVLISHLSPSHLSVSNRVMLFNLRNTF